MQRKGYVYIITNKTNTTIYIGVTNDIVRRMYEHKNHLIKGFSDKYNLEKLIYFEEYNLMTDAIKREKQLKGWTRKRKFELIKTQNPELIDIIEI